MCPCYHKIRDDRQQKSYKCHMRVWLMKYTQNIRPAFDLFIQNILMTRFCNSVAIFYIMVVFWQMVKTFEHKVQL